MAQSAPKGWKIDKDGWYVRYSRPGDSTLGGRPDIGFDDSTFPRSPPEGKVYVREPEYALAIDKGRLP